MPKSAHEHEMRPLSWTTQGEKPAVLMSCQRGVCARTEVHHVSKRSRKLPEGITEAQFAALREGKHWPEAVSAT